ncbi:MAG: hypothetical protein ACXADA_01580 [Candidatus Hodarchaeales archaeon]
MSENESKDILASLKEKHNKGELSKEEYNNLKKKYEGKKPDKLQFSLIEVSGSAKITSDYISVSGTARIDGYKGIGDSLKISGSGKISNEEIYISGSGKIPGDVNTTKLKNSGSSLKILGNVNVEELNSSGHLKVAGKSSIKEAKISGTSKFLSDVVVEEEIDSSGYLIINGKLASFDVRISGSFKITDIEAKGLFYAKIDSKSRVRSIVADTVMIESPRGAILSVTQEIRANGIAELENVRAKKVTAEKVKLYGDCQIDEVIETSRD